MSALTLRGVKGTLLTNDEVDTNFVNLNNDKLEAADLKTINGVSIVGTGDLQLSTGGSGSVSVDGGTANSVYLPTQLIDGGNANG